MIDAHTHLHPPRLFAAIRRWFAERSSWKLETQPTEPLAVAAALRAAGVERFVFFSYAHRTGMAREINAWLCATARELHGFGVPLATVHLDDPDYLDDLERALAGGCAGLKIHEDVQRLAVDDARFDLVYRRITEAGGVVVAHVGPVPWNNAPAGGPARVERVLVRHPELQFVVAHMGVPDTQAYCALTERHARLYLDTTMVLARGSPLALPSNAALVGRYAERILYGTDFPNIPYPYLAERRALENLHLPGPALERILGGNARRLLARFL
ncbi:MAG TPA: amidohydrolase family protein [Candidatus Baltobacteraceae bacterium]|nr:amidohydrolase family protein [Candidatus Baltobacteraceae bacterium]